MKLKNRTMDIQAQSKGVFARVWFNALGDYDYDVEDVTNEPIHDYVEFKPKDNILDAIFSGYITQDFILNKTA